MNFDCRTIFVGDLPNFVTDGDLRVLFASFGPIVDVQVHNGIETGRTSSYAFVTLASFAAIEAARKHLDSCIFLGKRIRLRRATVMHPKGISGSNSPPAVNSVYVRFVSSIIDHSITEFDLHRIFSLHGLVEDVIVKDCSIDLQAKQQFGYAFVHFTSRKDGVQAAFQSVAALDRATVEGITFHVEVSRNLLKQFGHQYNHAQHQAIPYQSPSQLQERLHLSRPVARSSVNLEKRTSPRDSPASLHRSASGVAFPTERFHTSLRLTECGVMVGKHSSRMNPGDGIREAHGNMREFYHPTPPFPATYQPTSSAPPTVAVAEKNGFSHEFGVFSARGGFVSRVTEAVREPFIPNGEWWEGNADVSPSLISNNALESMSASSKLPSGNHSLHSLPWNAHDSDARTVNQWSYADDTFSSPLALSHSARVVRETFVDDSETNLLRDFSLEKLSLCEEAGDRDEHAP